MTKVYIKQNGVKVEIEVSEEMANEMREIRRYEWRQESKARYHCTSMDRIEAKGSMFADPKGSPEEQLIAEEDHKKEQESLANALESLSAEQRKIVQMRFYDGMELQEIADEFGVTKQAIFNRIQKILKKLKKVF